VIAQARRAGRRETGVVTAIDHLILPVNDVAASVDFYSSVLGFADEGAMPPFSVVRVSPDFTIQLAGWGTDGGMHLAFAMTKPEFDAAFQRVKAAGLDYGDDFHHVGNQRGPGVADGARGQGAALYLMDPSKHLIELRHYEA
jgi:catechol 2,3-dioxygenase-like lactoylglutathione lyase family enzyme